MCRELCSVLNILFVSLQIICRMLRCSFERWKLRLREVKFFAWDFPSILCLRQDLILGIIWLQSQDLCRMCSLYSSAASSLRCRCSFLISRQLCHQLIENCSILTEIVRFSHETKWLVVFVCIVCKAWLYTAAEIQHITFFLPVYAIADNRCTMSIQ